MACLYTLPKTNFILYFFISKATTLHHFAFPKANKCSLVLKKCQPNFSMRKDTAFTQKNKKTKNKIGLSKQKLYKFSQETNKDYLYNWFVILLISKG